MTNDHQSLKTDSTSQWHRKKVLAICGGGNAAHAPGVCVIMFTMYSENIPKNAISSMGVDVVLSKTDGIAHLVGSINTVFAARASSHPPLNPA
jgi:hypothetical protein